MVLVLVIHSVSTVTAKVLPLRNHVMRSVAVQRLCAWGCGCSAFLA